MCQKYTILAGSMFILLKILADVIVHPDDEIYPLVFSFFFPFPRNEGGGEERGQEAQEERAMH
ncbi:hypothetical protein BJY01DRAFT_229723 [Aspergillus pseudoustus]|uniref:Uncharacterized protein n=1 Tax=Aspergillus pseudoustus TaxID=1810923 RepID=A0ABR4IF57_9EURO